MENNANYKSGFVALIGRPNVGKSTLMNHLIGQKIAITSKKPQTTRNRIQTVYTCDEGQIVFLDTPGIHKAKNKLGEYMVDVAEKTLKEVDVILWLESAISQRSWRKSMRRSSSLSTRPIPWRKIKSWNSSIRTASCSSLPRSFRARHSAIRTPMTSFRVSSNICRTARSSTMRTPSPISRCARSWLRSSARKHFMHWMRRFRMESQLPLTG